MSVTITHATQITGLNDPSYQVSKDVWNAGHIIVVSTGETLLGKGTSGSGAVAEIFPGHGLAITGGDTLIVDETALDVANMGGGPLGVTKGGTGTATQFTEGSIVFAGASGVYSQDNANLAWNNSTKMLTVGGKWTVQPGVGDGANNYMVLDTGHTVTNTSYNWIIGKANGTSKWAIGFSAGTAIAFRTFSNHRLDFDAGSGDIFFTSGRLFMQAYTSINRAGDASSTATQKDSKVQAWQANLWTGAAGQNTYAYVKAKASTTVNLRHSFGLWLNDTSGNGTGGTQVFDVEWLPSAGGKFGYATGVGGTVTQATDKSTGVTLSKSCGSITMNNASLAADTTVTFTLTNTIIESTDVLLLNHVSGGTAGAYTLNAQCGSGSATINVRNVTAGSLGEAIVIRFVLIKSVNA